MTIALLFPGQGSQRAGMLSDLPDTPAAARAYDEALDTLGSFISDALRVVKVRGTEMERACANGSWAMAALRGLRPTSAQRLVDAVSTEADPLWTANINASDQIVVSGTRTALDALRAQAPAAGARDLSILDVSVASHCPLQAETAAAVARALAQVRLGDQQRAYFANATGRRLLHAPDKVIDDLAQAVRQPVRWYDVVRLMPECGITATIQVPPGHVLTAISARETPAITSVAIDDIGLTAALRRARKASEA